MQTPTPEATRDNLSLPFRSIRQFCPSVIYFPVSAGEPKFWSAVRCLSLVHVNVYAACLTEMTNPGFKTDRQTVLPWGSTKCACINNIKAKNESSAKALTGFATVKEANAGFQDNKIVIKIIYKAAALQMTKTCAFPFFLVLLPELLRKLFNILCLVNAGVLKLLLK